MKKTFTIMFSILSILGYACIGSASCNPSCPPPSQPPCEPCRACEICPPCEPCCCTDTVKIGEPCNCAYNAPARIDTACGWDAWGTISFIYWQPKEKGLDVGFLFNEDPQGINQKYEVSNLKFDFIPGFKVGAGFSFCRDDWTLFLEYTRLDPVAREDEPRPLPRLRLGSSSPFQTPITSNIFSIWVEDILSDFTTVVIDSVKVNWKIDYNIFDLELGRPYYLGKKLIFKPHFGLRAGWIDQTYNFKCLAFLSPDQVNLYSVESKNHQDSWLIGPRTGLGTDWLVGCHFRIFGNVAGSLTYQKFNYKDKQFLPAQFTAVPVSLNFLAKDEISFITPNVEFALGLGYGNYFFCDRWYFDLAVGYDFHYYWNQNMMRHLKDDETYFGDFDAGNLMLQGLTITARVDF